MYFKVKPFLHDPDFSWVISKNPTSVFERDLSNQPGARVVRSSFEEDGWYAGQVHNDPLQHMLALRQRNEASYVEASLHAVCPANLAGFAVVFRSALSGKNPSPSKLTDEQFFAPKVHVAELGPFPGRRHQAVVALADVGITATVLEEGTKEAFTLVLQSSTPVSTTEFLQKIYVVSYYLTCRGNQELTGDQVDRFVRLSAGWLDPLPCKARMVRELCSFKDGKASAYSKKLHDLKTKDVDESTVLDLEEESHVVATEEGAPPLEREREPTLHERRHELVKECIVSDIARSTLVLQYRVVDYGCAEGRLSALLGKALAPSGRVLGVDARIKDRARQRLRRDGLSDRVSLVVGNLLYPDLGEEWADPDALILSEVIEHFELKDRQRLLDVVCREIAPKLVVLTTPNVAYNTSLGIEPGQFRHWDHRVEFDQNQLAVEVLQKFRACGYDIELLDLVPGAEVQPSFVVKATRQKNAPRARTRPQCLFSSFHLDATDYTVTKREIQAGVVAPACVANVSDVFYLGPTMAPVDYDPNQPGFLEHPRAAFEYYRSRGVDQIVAQRKYMGSRAYIALVRDPAMAEAFGLSSPCVVNSRSGMRFFDRGDPALDQIYTALQATMTTDLLVLDCEILPWTLKAEGLIRKEFTIPGEAALLARKRSGVGLNNAEKFCQVLEGFATPAPMEVRPFHVLATANLSERKKPKDVVVGLYHNQDWHMHEIVKLSGGWVSDGVVRNCVWHRVNVHDPYDCQHSIALWENYCVNGGEGFVYKPADGIVLRGRDGYLMQPAVKVRGKDYLRIIYGIDYLEPEFFDRLKKRSTKRKRVLAVQQQELGERMLLAFLRGNQEARTRYAAAFMGVEDVNYGSIDRTL